MNNATHPYSEFEMLNFKVKSAVFLMESRILSKILLIGILAISELN